MHERVSPQRSLGNGKAVCMNVDRCYRIVGRVLITLLILLLSGCASARKPKSQAAPPLEGPGNIPIPSGFQKISEDSVLISMGGFEAGLVVYKGDREPPWVVEFYRGTLPTQGWAMVASFISKDSILVFTKKDQACVIRVSGSGSSSRLEVRIGIAGSRGGGPSQSPRARPRY